MLAAEALRLSAIEILLPTAVQESGPYPTLAGYRVYDSRAVALEDLDQDGPYTPVLSLYTPESGAKLRGPHSAAGDTEADAVLEIVAELAVSAVDNGVTYVDAMPATDPEARLVLAALCAQVRRLLERSQVGGLWRRLVRQITETEYKTFAVPEIGLRWHRVTIRMHCEIRDDDFDMEAGGLPEPIKSLYASLPDASYAKAKLAALAAHFDPEILPALDEIHVTSGPVKYGLKPPTP
jgi:muconolactone delta-isomerase